MFTELTILLIKKGYIDGKHYFLDGTKIEANANKYSFVWKKNVLNYEDQAGLFGERNSFSKTDPDATFMRMKDDHMNNGQLKAVYNWQVGTQDQFILFYTIHHNPTDTRCLEPHIAKFKESNSPLPETIIADAGYGSEANYVAMEDEDLETLIPYNTYRQKQKRLLVMSNKT